MKGKKTNIYLTIAICLLIIAISSLYIYMINFQNKKQEFVVEDGVLNLEDWDMKGSIKLDGQWEFYPNQLLNPDDLKDKGRPPSYIKVPGTWNLLMGDKADGAGTYRTTIKVPEPGIYAIKSRTIRLASKIFLNKVEVANAGQVSTSREGYVPESKYKIGVDNSIDNKLELVIQVSSYNYGTGGILKSVEFGTMDHIMLSHNKSRALDALSISTCLILGIYFLIIYLQRREDTYLLYFSLASLTMALYFSTMNEQLLDLVYDYNFTVRTRIQALVTMIMPVVLLQFVNNFFAKYNKKRIKKVLLYLQLSLLPLALVDFQNLPVKWAMLSQLIIIAVYGAIYFYIFTILIRVLEDPSYSSEYIWIIMTSLILYWILLGMKMYFELDLGQLQAILTLFMFLGASALLAHRYHLEYKELNHLSHRLMIQDELKDNFLATASHELRTPLHIILNLTRNLIEGEKGTLNPKQREDLYFINHEGERLVRLVDELLDASKIKTGKVNVSTSIIRPFDLIDNLLGEIRYLIPEEKEIRLKNSVDKNFPPLEADADKFMQIIYNLVSNSIKYTNKGEINISAYVKGEYAYIEVQDTGIGIEAEDLDMIFDIFYRKDRTKKTQGDLGLGLAITKHLVEIQGGQIEVESVFNKGSIFRFSLPLSKDRSKDAEITAVDGDLMEAVYKEVGNKEIIAKGSNQYTILIGDDNEANLKVIVDMLKPSSFDIILARTGTEIIEAVKKHNIDLLILDFMLPDISGAQVCKEIRKQYSMVELPILVLTASGRNMDLVAAFEQGANDFVNKPAERRELIPRIQSLLLMKESADKGLEEEFKYFYSQISPHFLYNTLNTIIGLSYKDGEKTREALGNLAIYLRGKLNVHSDQYLVPLKEELELVKAYLEIEKLRYGSKLQVEYDMDQNIFVLIPSLTIQPLVENSIRHGLRMKKEDWQIRISTRRVGEKIYITVEDNGIGMSKEKKDQLLAGNSEGVGFKNVLKKIQRIKNASIELESRESEGTRVIIIMPGGEIL